MKIVFFTIAVLIFLFFSVRFLEYKSLYFPFKRIDATPKDIGLDFEDMILTAKDGINISAWFIPAESSRAVMLFSHGNGGNISHRLEKIKIFNELDLDVLIFDYRGYGKSEGRPSENGLYLDAEAVYDHLVKERKMPYQKIIGYGESLGGAVIIDLASKREMGGIIIEDCFTSVRDMGRELLPFIPAFLYKSSFDSLTKIKSVEIPKLILHSADDEIIPFEQGRKLFDNAPVPKEFIELKGGHNEAFYISRDVYSSAIGSFVKKIR